MPRIHCGGFLCFVPDLWQLEMTYPGLPINLDRMNPPNRVSYHTQTTMPVTFTVATHSANPVRLPRPYKPLSAQGVLEQTWGRKSGTVVCNELLQSSLASRPQSQETILLRANGFVDTVVQAYNDHHHLVLRLAFAGISLSRCRCVIGCTKDFYNQTRRCVDRDPLAVQCLVSLFL